LENNNLKLFYLNKDYYNRFLQRFPNGYINKQEFNDIVSKVVIDEQNAQDSELKIYLCKRIFDFCDKDENGTIDFKEYFVNFFIRLKSDMKQKLELIFDMFDSNKNNAIDFNELHTFVQILLKLKQLEDKSLNDLNNFKEEIFKNQISINYKLPFSYHVSLYIMKRFDSDKNGKISKDEFVNGCLENEKIKKFLIPLKMF
jgi:Ca2+-binding EF-hand superfamily protein